MAANWFYLDPQNNQTGPVSEARMTELHSAGTVTDTTQVWQEGMADWVPFSSVKDKFVQATPPPATSPAADTRPCPYCGGQIKAAAKICKHCKKNVPPVVGVPQVAGIPTSEPIDFKVPLILYAVSAGLLFLSILAHTRVFPYDFRHFLQDAGPVAFAIVGIIAVVFTTRMHYFCWKAVPENTRPFSPGRAVGFLFIPFYNFYWVFEAYPKLARLLNVAASGKSQKKASPGLGIALAVLFIVTTLFDILAESDDDWTVLFLMSMIAGFIVWLLFFKTVVEVANAIIGQGGAR